MAQDYFAELKKKPYPLYAAPKPYSFDLNEDMVQMVKKDFSAAIIVAAMSEAIKGHKSEDAAKAAEAFFKDMGERWMQRAIQLSDEYPDRTIEMVMETVDRQGRQFLIFPHLHQRYVEVGYLGMQDFLKVPITLNNARELSYRVPRCSVYAGIKASAGEEFAAHMACSQMCLTGLGVIQRQIPSVDVMISQPAKTSKEGFCEFSLRKL